jgi:lysophospholipase L1-like esterase
MRKLFLLALIVISFISFQSKPVTWTAIGDSITYLNDHLDETGNRVTKGYMTRVTERLKNVRYINQGHNGWTAGMIAHQIDSLGLVTSDVYTVFLGTNDWWQGHHIGTMDDYKQNTGTGTIYGSFKIIIDKIRSLNSKAKIILITPMQRTDFVYVADAFNNAFGSYKDKDDQSLEAVSDAIRNIGQHENVAVIDLYHASGMAVKDMVHFKRLKNPQTGKYENYRYPGYINIPYHPDTDEYPYPQEAIDVTFDGLHPSDKGNKMIANKLIKVFKK